MAQRKYQPNSAGMRKILASPRMRRVCRRVAERKGVPAFQAAAPRVSGEYARDVTVEDATGWDGRAGVRIVSRRRTGGSLSIEFGTSDTPASHALQAAINAIEGRR